MTKREARKIATLVTAALISENEFLGTLDERGWDAAHKVSTQAERLAFKLASRYDVSFADLPSTENEIVEHVMDGTL